MKFDNWDDNEEKIDVGKHLEKMGYKNVVYDYFMCFDKLTGELNMIAQSLTREQVERYKVQHPDVLVFGAENRALFVVEIDGSIHHTKPGMKQTANRNSTYHKADVQCIVLDKMDLKVLKMTWQDYLDSELKAP